MSKYTVVLTMTVELAAETDVAAIQAVRDNLSTIVDSEDITVVRDLEPFSATGEYYE